MVLLESSRGNRVQGINEIVLINDLNQQGLSVLAIAQQVGYDRKTVKKYIERSLEARYDGLGHEGSYLALKPFLREVSPPVRTQFERWFETPPGQQAQMVFAAFSVAFTDEPVVTRKVWLFSSDEPSIPGR